MNLTKLNRANELVKLIKTTSEGIAVLKKIQAKAKAKPACGPEGCDTLYNFFVGEYADSRDCHAELCRYNGNDELLAVVIATLEKQHAAFTEEFKSL